MRVIAGAHKGRRLKTPVGNQIRPTSERVREALFSILDSRIPQAHVLDLCCGTGTIGLEAMSRGASHVVFVDHDRNSLQLLRNNLKRCGNPENVAIIREDAWNVGGHAQLLQQAPYDVIFVDPPYQRTEIGPLLEQIGTPKILSHDGMIVVEHFWKTELPQQVGSLEYRRHARYGDARLTFYQQFLHSHANRRLSRNI